MSLPSDNVILRTDSYKASHFLQYPPGTTRLLGYFESRGGLYGETVFFGPNIRISPNDLHIQYFSWSCVNNCVLPCFGWRRILNEKYEITPVPKVYSLMTPDHDGQELNVKIKSPIPLTVALVPSHLADQVYDKTISLTDALDKTGCKERGVQSMSFHCSFNVANGTQTLLILPEMEFSGHKKATVEASTEKCIDHCDLLPPPPNQ